MLSGIMKLVEIETKWVNHYVLGINDYNLVFRRCIYPCNSKGTEFACNSGDQGSIPGSGRSYEEGNGNPLQYSCLENPMDRGAWRATVCGVAKSGIQLGNRRFHFYLGNLLDLRNERTGWPRICVVVHNNIFTMFLRRNLIIDAGAWFFFFFNFDALTLKPESAKKKCSLYI